MGAESVLQGSSALTLLRRGATGAFLVQIAGAAFGMGAHLLVARLLGPVAYGDYALVLTWISVLCVLALVGQDSTVVRFLPRYLYDARWRKARGLRRVAPAIVAATSVAISLAGSAVVFGLQARLSRSLELTFFMGFVLLPVLAQLQLSGALHRALKHAVSASLFSTVVRPAILMALMLLVAYGLDIEVNSPLAVLVSAGAALFALWASNRFLRPAWSERVRRGIGAEYEVRQWVTVGRRLFFLSAVGVALNRLDVLVLGALGGADQVGPYYVAVQLAGIALYGLNAVNTILAPLTTQHYAAGDSGVLSRLVQRAATITFGVTTICAVALATSGYWILARFGPGFTQGYMPLLVLLGGQCVNAAVGPVGYLMTMTSFERQAPVIFGVGAFFNLLLSVFLVPRYGMLGAAWAATAGTVIWNVVALIFVRQRLDINPTILPL